MNDNGELELIHFMSEPYWKYMSYKKQVFWLKYPVGTTESKIQYLLEKIDEIKLDMKLHYQRFSDLTEK